MSLIQRLRPYLSAWGWDRQDEVLDVIGPVRGPLERLVGATKRPLAGPPEERK